jgi:hypothetical protein
MPRYVTVSAKIPEELKKQMEELGLRPGQVIREAIEERVRERLLLEVERRAGKLLPKLEKITDEEVSRMIREDREGR